MEHFSWADCFIPCFRFLNYKEDIKHILRKDSYYTRPENNAYKGFQDFDKKWDGRAYASIDSIDYKEDKQIKESFEHFLTQCKEENIQVILVKAPYYIGATKNTEFGRNDETIRRPRTTPPPDIARLHL